MNESWGTLWLGYGIGWGLSAESQSESPPRWRRHGLLQITERNVFGCRSCSLSRCCSGSSLVLNGCKSTRLWNRATPPTRCRRSRSREQDISIMCNGAPSGDRGPKNSNCNWAAGDTKNLHRLAFALTTFQTRFERKISNNWRGVLRMRTRTRSEDVDVDVLVGMCNVCAWLPSRFDNFGRHVGECAMHADDDENEDEDEDADDDGAGAAGILNTGYGMPCRVPFFSRTRSQKSSSSHCHSLTRSAEAVEFPLMCKQADCQRYFLCSSFS